MRSLRTRLLLTFVGLILAGFTLLALLAGRQISAGTVEDFASSLGEQAEIIADVLHEPVEESLEHDGSLAQLGGILQTYAQQTEATVVLVDRNGRFAASSSGEETETDTPEIRDALTGSVSNDTRGSTAYAAAPVWEDGRVIAAVQLAAPLSAAQSLVVQRWLGLAAAVLGVTIVAGLAAFWLSTTLTRPLAQLQQAANQVAQGNFSQRLPATRQDEIGDVARAFNEMTTQVEAMIEEQRAFASNASHELRTPLTTIRLRSEALRDNSVDPDTARQYIVEIDNEVQRMGSLVQDLILLSRLDSGRLEAGQEQIDPIRLAQQLIAEHAAQAEARHIDLRLDAPDALPSITAGYTHITILFRNLLSNALKYTPDGGQITWRLQQVDDTLQSTITDTGRGIPPEDLPHLFDRFYRVDKSRSRAVPGVGLGLSLARMIVQFYGGTIRVESEGVGHGTTITVQWPL